MEGRNVCEFLRLVRGDEKPGNLKNLCFTKVFEGVRRNMKILKLEPHETREPGSRETRALPDPQKSQLHKITRQGELTRTRSCMIFITIYDAF